MEIDVIERKDVVYWGWGSGGHELFNGPGGPYPMPHQQTDPARLNNPQPLEVDFLDRIEQGGELYRGVIERFNGWVTKPREYAQTRKQKDAGVKPDTYQSVYWFLRKMVGDSIDLSAQDVDRLRAAYNSFHQVPDKEADQPIVISEIGFYDANMKLLRVVNTMVILNLGDAHRFVFDFRSVAEKAASDAAWEHSENERAARGALM